jgi:hypothetical protein
MTGCNQGVTKRCRLSLLTNSALVNESQWRGGGASANVYSYAHHWTWSPNFGDLPPYLTYGCNATCDYDAVGPEEGGGPGGLRNVHVLRDGVGRVLLLYVAKDGDIAAADLAAVAQQRPRAGINPS